MTDLIAMPADQVRVKYLRVTNTGNEIFTDRHNGVPTRIEPGATKNVPLDTAQHIFGWTPNATTEEMFKHVQRRQGWNTKAHFEIDPESKQNIAETKFSKIKIEPVMYRLVEVEHDPKKPIAADPPIPDDPPLPEAAPPPPQEEGPRIPRRVDVRA